MLRAEQITKRIGARTILQGIDLQVGAGELAMIFGPNGAGKSTLMKILALLSKPTDGKLSIAGLDTGREGSHLRRCIGLISHQTLLYENLTAYENLHYYASMYQVDRITERIQQLIQQVGLEFHLNDPIRTFSRGMQQRLAIARALIHDPDILYLDEPYTGLDQQAVHIFHSVLKQLKGQGKTIVMITHDFHQGLSLADRIVFMKRGKVVLDEMAKDLTEQQIKAKYLDLTGGGNGDLS